MEISIILYDDKCYTFKFKPVFFEQFVWILAQAYDLGCALLKNEPAVIYGWEEFKGKSPCEYDFVVIACLLLLNKLINHIFSVPHVKCNGFRGMKLSALKRIKTYLHCPQGQERLSHLFVIRESLSCRHEEETSFSVFRSWHCIGEKYSISSNQKLSDETLNIHFPLGDYWLVVVVPSLLKELCN